MTPHARRRVRQCAMDRGDLDKIEASIMRRWPIIAARANLPRPQTPDERRCATQRVQLRRRRKDIGILSLQVFAMFVVLLAVAASAVLFSGGSP